MTITQELFDLNQTIAAELFQDIVHPWIVLPVIQDFIPRLIAKLPSTYKEIKENVWVGEGTTIAPTATIIGPAIIGCHTEIRHAAYIRQHVIIGDHVVVGNATEVKNSILFNKVQIPHFNYVGDSILGYKAHLGAGVKLSNVKSDYTPISLTINGEKYETSLKKIGALLGDGVEIGCNAVLNPGTIIGKNSNVYPLTLVRGTIPANHIFKNDGSLVQKR